MKKARHKIIFLIGLLTIFAVPFFFFFPSEEKVEDQGVGSQPQPPKLTVEDPPARKPARNPNTKKSTDDEVVEKLIETMSEEERRVKPEDVTLGEWAYFVWYHNENLKKNGKIEFYGKVIDSEGNPLPGLKVNGKIRGYNPSIAEVAKDGEKWIARDIVATTDGAGRFSVTGLTGVTLTFQMIGDSTDYRIQGQEGYGFSFVPEGVNSAFDPSHQPKKSDPVVFVFSRE